MKQQNSNGNHSKHHRTIGPNVARAKDAPRITEATTAESASSPSSDDWLNSDECNALLSSFRRGQGGFTLGETATVVLWTGGGRFLPSSDRASRGPGNDHPRHTDQTRTGIQRWPVASAGAHPPAAVQPIQQPQPIQP